MGIIFLDRDGVINENRADYVKSWEEFHFLPGALDALRLLTRLGHRIFVVTNQASINRGLVDQAVVETIHRRMQMIARSNGAVITDIRFCPHRDDEGCNCRKPRPGMLFSLAAKHGLILDRAVMVGDALSDIAAAKAAGCGFTMLVRTGRGSEQQALPAISTCRPDLIIDDLYSAALWLHTHEAELWPTVAVYNARAIAL